MEKTMTTAEIKTRGPYTTTDHFTSADGEHFACRLCAVWGWHAHWHVSNKTLYIYHPDTTIEIVCRSADNPRSIEGLTVAAVIIDEWELHSLVDDAGTCVVAVGRGKTRLEAMTAARVVGRHSFRWSSDREWARTEIRLAYDLAGALTWIGATDHNAYPARGNDE